MHDSRQIVLSELIDSNGVTILGLQVLGDLLTHDATFLAALVDQKLGDADEFETTVSLYSQCLQNKMKLILDTDDEHERFNYLLSGAMQRFTLKELQIETECYFPHAARAYQNAGAALSVFSYEILKPYLNDYGYCLLIEQRSDCQP